MFKRIFFLIFFFYFLAIFQGSFWERFFQPDFLNLILIFVFLINLWEKREGQMGWFAAFFGGFFWDIFSNHFIGWGIFLSLVLAFLTKNFLKIYVRIPSRI